MHAPTSYSESKAAFLAAFSAARSRASSAPADLIAFNAVAVTASPAHGMPRYASVEPASDLLNACVGTPKLGVRQHRRRALCILSSTGRVPGQMGRVYASIRGLRKL